jgi:hypothetical protein
MKMRMAKLNRVFPDVVARTCKSRLTGERQFVTGLKDLAHAVIKSAPCKMSPFGFLACSLPCLLLHTCETLLL